MPLNTVLFVGLTTPLIHSIKAYTWLMAKKKNRPSARNLTKEKEPVIETTDKTDRVFPPTVEKHIRLADLALGKKAGKP